MSPLARILRPERFRQRTARSSTGTLGGSLQSVPAIAEFKFDTPQDPLLATNMRRTFVPTRCSSEGIGRYGFSEIPIEEEEQLVPELYRCLVAVLSTNRWPNRCKTVSDGLEFVESSGFAPKHVLLPKSDFCSSTIEEQDLDRLAMAQGYVAEMKGGVQVFLADLPKGAALVTAAPESLGMYTRVGNHLGLLLHQIDRTLSVVCP